LVVDRKKIEDALRGVSVPALKRDVVDLELVRDVLVDKGRVQLMIDSPTPGDEAKQRMRDSVTRALGGIPGIERVDLEVEWRVPKGRNDGRQSVPGISNIVAVSSGKGGVGKSTVAVNMAIALSQYGAKVGLLDTDVYGPNVPIMVGVNEEPQVRGQRLLPHQVYGISVMSLGFLNRGDRPVVWRGPMLHTAVRQFLYDVEWGELDYLVVDMPPGTGDAQLSLAQLVPVQGAVLVTTPQEVALADVRKAFNMFEQVRVPVLGVVENMSYFLCGQCSTRHAIFGTGGGEDLAKGFNTVLLGQVPLAVPVREGGDRGVPIVVGSPGGQEAAAFRAIADRVAEQLMILAMTTAALPVIDMGDNRGDRFEV
jgi:ATP-binding protein involved in chromosome partitioning